MKINKENLKCCGNCKHRLSIDSGKFHLEKCSKNKYTSSFEYCNKWKFDGLTKKIRRIEPTIIEWIEMKIFEKEDFDRISEYLNKKKTYKVLTWCRHDDWIKKILKQKVITILDKEINKERKN